MSNTLRKAKICADQKRDSAKYHIAQENIRKNINRVRDKIQSEEVLNVVFIVQYIPSWNKLEPIYSKMLKDERFCPYIVCVPDRIEFSKLKGDSDDNEVFEYMRDAGYECINALLDKGTWFDIKELDPDYVFHSRPYNNFMPREYTSDEICKYALLCNVLYGPGISKNGQDVTLNEKYYKDVFCYFAFDAAEKEFYEDRFKIGVIKGTQRCLPFGAVSLESMLEARCEREDFEFRKVVLWTPRWSTDSYIGGSNFFTYKDNFVHLAKEYPDVKIIIRPHPLMFSNFLKTGELTQEDYEEFRSFCELQKNVELDERNEYADTFWQSDLMISDFSSIISEYFITGKPIMYCHSNVNFEYTKASQEMIDSCYNIYDEKDLIEVFRRIVEDDDVKEKDRLSVIDKYFSNVNECSKDIVNTLATMKYRTKENDTWFFGRNLRGTLYSNATKCAVGVRTRMLYLDGLKLIKKNNIRVKAKIARGEVLNVVFIAQYSPAWNKLGPIYSQLKNDERFNPIIVCVPYNIVHNELKNEDYSNDTYEYMCSCGYDCINALSETGEWFDLRELQPDYVFHSRPYNQTMPIEYTSRHISKYSLICNVNYGASITENDQDISINWRYYKDVFCYFAYDNGDKKFFEKRFKLGCRKGVQRCKPYGAIGPEQMLQSRPIDRPTTAAKTVIWTPRWSTDSYIGGSNFFNYKDTIIELAEKNPEVKFVIRPHPLMFSNFIKTGEMTEAEEKDFRDYCKNKPNVHLDEDEKYSNTFWNSDFLISDFSSILPEYYVTGKPILYCHSNAAFKYAEASQEMIDSCYNVFDRSELIMYFNQLIEGKDNKNDERQACLSKNFSNVSKCSENIKEYLAHL